MENITLEELSKKTLADLRTIAKELNIKSVTKYKKNELVELISDNYQNSSKSEKNIKNSEEYISVDNTKAETQRQEKENTDYNGNRNKYTKNYDFKFVKRRKRYGA